MLRRLGIAAFAVAWLASGLGPATAASITPLEGAVARYQGRLIGLGDGWDGASICAVYTAVDVRCYDTDAEFRADQGLLPGTMSAQGSMSDCGSGWACLWEFVNWGGRRLQFNDPGSDQGLAKYDFRDKASAVYNHLPPGYYFDLKDYRTGWNDQRLVFVWTSYQNDLRDEPYPGGVYGGGTWNNKADSILVRRV